MGNVTDIPEAPAPADVTDAAEIEEAAEASVAEADAPQPPAASHADSVHQTVVVISAVCLGGYSLNYSDQTAITTALQTPPGDCSNRSASWHTPSLSAYRPSQPWQAAGRRCL